ncbi:thioredoxin family protein [Candidatus Pacearchaeota archaeon]|nr:thioredoxin family protein [Candidatus Pacearchaeota archaeon]
MESQESETEVTYEEFNDIIKNNEHVVVNFFAEWHMPCLMLSPVIEDLAEKLNHVRFISINIEDNAKLKDVHKVSTMPCVIIFKKGNEIARVIGCHAADILEDKVKEVLN